MPQGSFEASSSRNGSAPPEIRPNLIALVSLTHTLCEAGRVNEAEELCRLILKEQPGLAIAQAALGRALYEAGKLDDAEQCLERTVGQTPGCFAAHRWLAEVLVQRGAWDQAQAVLTQAAVLSPENPRVRQLLQTLPHPGPTATEPGRPSHTEEFTAAEVERPQPRRPRTTEYPAPDYEELPYVPVEHVDSEDIEEFVTEPNVPRLKPLSFKQRLTAAWVRARARALATLRGLDWRAVGAAAAVGLGLAMALGLALWVMSRSGQTPSLPAREPEKAAPAPRPTPSAAANARRQLERAIAAGDLGALLTAVEQAAPHLDAPEVASARLFAAAVMASDYGVPVTDDAATLLERLQPGANGQLSAELAASRLLLALASGAHGSPLPTDRETTESPWLAYAVAKARRLSGAAEPVALSDLGPAVVLQAEALIDAGQLGPARDLLNNVLDRVPAQSRARLALAEVRVAAALPATGTEATQLRGACALDGPRSPVVDGACKLIAAEEARRAGDRGTARLRALQVATLAPPEPRLLAHTAQVLLNLGETKRAQELVERAVTLASPGYTPLAWAQLGLRLNRGEDVSAEKTLAPDGPESRLLAVRAALARAGAAGVGGTLRGMGPQQVNADPDLSWFALLARVQQRHAAVRLAERFMAPGAKPPSTVGAYVLGLLARWGGRRHLAAYWLARARVGHGDACTASTLYLAAESDLGRKPMMGGPPDCTRTRKR